MTTNNINNRQFFPSTDLRAYNLDEDSSKRMVGGYAIVFNSESRDLGGFTEFVAPEALNRALERNSDVLALYNHDYANILGRQSSETLRLYKDEKGLRFELDLPDTSLGRDIYELVKRGDLKGNSFGFTVKRDSWKKKEGKVYRTIEEIKDLYEVSIVSMPAYEATDLMKRSFDEFIDEADKVKPNEVTEEVVEETIQEEQTEEKIEESNDSGVYPQSILKHL